MMSQGAQESNLSGISDVLHCLKAHLDSQDTRLDFIESYIRSGAASPVPNASSTEEETAVRNERLPERPSSFHESPGTLPETGSAAAAYQASLLELQERFLKSSSNRRGAWEPVFRDDSETLRSAPKPASLPELGDSSGSSGMIYDDAYSVSVYPSEYFARSEVLNVPQMGIPTIPALPATTAFERDNDDPELLENSIPYSSTVSPIRMAPETPPVTLLSRSSSLKFWKNRSGRPSSSSARSARSTSSRVSARQQHERVELTYYAYDNFWKSLFSVTERRASRNETRRLSVLAMSTPKVQDCAKSSWLLGLQRLISGMEGKLTLKQPLLVSFIS